MKFIFLIWHNLKKNIFLKILYIHQYFKTPEEGGAIRSYHFSKALIEAGFEVEVLTTHSQKFYQKKYLEDGLRVHYLPIHYNNSLNKWERIRSFLKFYNMSLKVVKHLVDIDLCFATSTPLTVAYLGMKIQQKYKIPFYVEIRDLWPKAPIELGFIKNKVLQKILYRYEKRIYKKAQKIVALSPTSQKTIQKKVPKKEVVFIPNMADIDFFMSQPPPQLLLEEYGLENKFGIAYIGTLGKANHLEYLLDIAESCQKNSVQEIQFLIIGEGAEKENLAQICKNKNLINVSFFSHKNKQELKNILDACQATYTSFMDVPVLESTSPNKFFDSLANGKLTIVNTQGWLKQLVEENQCGFYANPHQTQDFLDKIKLFLEDRNMLIKSQNNALKLAKQRFDKRILCQRFVNIFPTPK